MDFEFSFWNYTAADACPSSAAAAAEEWKYLGITTGFSYLYEPGRGGRDFIRELIIECGKAGIRLILNDTRAMWHALASRGEEAYAAGVREMLAEFKGDAVCGCYIGDEPDSAHMPVYRRAVEIFASLTPVAPFVNFFPYNVSMERTYGSQDAYLDAVSDFAGAGLQLLSYDRYSQLRAHEYEPGFLEDGLNRYYADLNGFTAAAKRLGLPLWVSQLSTGHWMYRTPDETDIRWQIATAAAHGVSGIQWFFVYQHRWADDYFSYPVRLDGGKTPLYHAIAYETRSFRERILRQLDGFSHAGVWHLDLARGGTPLFTRETDPKIFIHSDHGLGGIVARFVSAGGEVKYLVVNSHQTLAENYWFERQNGEAEYCWLPAGGSHVVSVK